MNDNTRLVCWFSCGAASAVATKLAITENAKRATPLQVVIARCLVAEEHEDNDRFAADCAKWFGLPITTLSNLKYGASIYEVFERRRYVSGIEGAPCTSLLKKRVRQDFERPTDSHIFGYCAEEIERFDRFLDANNIHATSPLIGKGLTHSDCLALIQKAGIAMPAMYLLGYKHNNCIGCCKASGQGYWNKIRVDFPAQFKKMCEVTRRLNARLLHDGKTHKFLDELTVGAGRYDLEPEAQCGVFCELANQEIGEVKA